jgi:hypothetical protein
MASFNTELHSCGSSKRVVLSDRCRRRVNRAPEESEKERVAAGRGTLRKRLHERV